MNLYALIMAGGTGTRLWPRSRTDHPKQFLELTGKWTLLQESQARLEPLIPAEKTLVATNQDYVEIVTSQLPTVPVKNIIGEPSPRGTAAAIGLAAVHLRQRDPGAIMVVVTADQVVAKTDIFRQALAAAAEVARQDWLVTLGIKPDRPETGYGYIQRGKVLAKVNNFNVHKVVRFVEKPDLPTAHKYFERGNYFWNSGMFIWKVERILAEISQAMPDLYRGLQEIEHNLNAPQSAIVMEQVWRQLPRQTIDYGVMEKADRVVVLPIDVGWTDLGSWSTVYDVMPQDKQKNAIIGKLISIDTQGTLVFSPKRLVASIGLEDMVIVDTDDVLLVCPRERSQEVKTLVNMLKTRGEEDYLVGAKKVRPVLNSLKVRKLFTNISSDKSTLLSLLIHAGISSEVIPAIKIDQIDLSNGWLNLPEEQRPLPDKTVKFLSTWIKALPSGTQILFPQWKSENEIIQVLEEMGKVHHLVLTPDTIRETLARLLFEISEEGRMIRSVLGEEATLLHLTLSALFPFSIKYFGDSRSELAVRARFIINRAADLL